MEVIAEKSARAWALFSEKVYGGNVVVVVDDESDDDDDADESVKEGDDVVLVLKNKS